MAVAWSRRSRRLVRDDTDRQDHRTRRHTDHLLGIVARDQDRDSGAGTDPGIDDPQPRHRRRGDTLAVAWSLGTLLRTPNDDALTYGATCRRTGLRGPSDNKHIGGGAHCQARIPVNLDRTDQFEAELARSPHSLSERRRDGTAWSTRLPTSKPATPFAASGPDCVPTASGAPARQAGPRRVGARPPGPSAPSRTA